MQESGTTAPTDAPVVMIPAHTAANLRRSVLVAVVVGVVAAVVLGLFGHPFAGVFLIVGLFLGALNTYAVQRSVVSYARQASKARAKSMVGNTMLRLGLITVVALAIVWFMRPDGFGVLGGLALFQVLMIFGAAGPMLKELKKT